MTTHTASWHQAHKAPFEAFGILYYPLFRNHADLPTALDDADLCWAVTANTNLEGTGYTLSQTGILTLAACHRALADAARGTALLPHACAADATPNPLDDLKRLVPDVTARPLYPDFPSQVMALDEAQFRYDQACHYLSTYGVELVAGQLGLDVTVGEGWLPQVAATPKTARDEVLVAPKVLHLLATVEDLEAVVAARLSRATRMHPAELEATLLVFANRDDDATDALPKVAFHENMLELIRYAAQADAGTLERVAAGLAQHPGDLLKATRYLLATTRRGHLATRQKKGLCRAFEHFATQDIARNIADAGRADRRTPNYLSASRFAGPHLREALDLVERGAVRSWAGELEQLWHKVGLLTPPSRDEVWQRLFAEYDKRPTTSVRAQFNQLYDDVYNRDRPDSDTVWRELLAFYGQRPGVLLRSLARLLRAGCPLDLLTAAMEAHRDALSLPTLVRTLTLFSTPDTTRIRDISWADFRLSADDRAARRALSPTQHAQLCTLLRTLVDARLRSLATPLAGKRVWLDTAGISLVGSVLMPNDTGQTGTAWPPVGIAFDLPRDKTVRFFTFWDHRATRVDVDLHFVGRNTSGETIHVGWNSAFNHSGLVTSGDVTTSKNSVEYLDAHMQRALDAGITYVVQQQHIFCGVRGWGDIETCYSGALVVSRRARGTALYNPENLLFRDDLTGEGTSMSYAVVNVPDHYVRILRGANLPLGTAGFSLGSYLEALFAAQGVTLVDTPDEAELRVCVGRSDDPSVVSLFDEGFFLG